MKAKKHYVKFFNMILCLAMLIGFLPINNAYADDSKKTEKVMQTFDGIDVGDTVYYGIYNNGSFENGTEWTVLDDKNTNVGTDGLFLHASSPLQFLPTAFCEYALMAEPIGPSQKYRADGMPISTYQGSSLQDVCEKFATETYFTKEEISAMMETTKQDLAGTYDNWSSGESSLENDKMFSLSAEEYEKYKEHIIAISENWWLRSNNGTETYVGSIGSGTDGQIINSTAAYTKGGYFTRPAFNIKESDVVYASKAGQKSRFTNLVNKYTISENKNSSTPVTKWQLTIYDQSRFGFEAKATSYRVIHTEEARIVTFDYSGAQTGENENLAILIKDENGNITHYGVVKHLNAATDESGTAEVCLPTSFDTEKHTLYVYSEKYGSGDDAKLTDYASNLVQLWPMTNAAKVSAVVTEPVEGTKPDTNPVVAIENCDGLVFDIDYTRWYRIPETQYKGNRYDIGNWENCTDYDFDNSYRYKVVISLKTKSGSIAFPKTIVGSVNGNAAYEVEGGIYQSEERVNLSYVFPAMGSHEEIIPVTNVTATVGGPTLGEKPDTTPTISSTPADSVVLDKIIWSKISAEDYTGTNTDLWQELSDTETFEAGYYYRAQILLSTSDTSYEMDEALTGIINGKTYADPFISKYSAKLVALFNPLAKPEHKHTADTSKWLHDENTHWNPCTDSTCTAHLNEAEHKFEWKIDKEATVDETGLKHEECVCGLTRNENTVIDKLTEEVEPNPTPSTGDNFNLSLYVSLMMISGTALIITIFNKKKKYNR